MKKIITVLSIALLSTGAFAQHHDHNSSEKGEMQSKPMFKDQALGNAYSNYIDVKEALFASNAEDASKASAELDKSLAGVDNSEAARTAASKVQSAGDLKAQRKAFAELSLEMSNLIKGGKLSMGAVYMEFCPMANNNEGAFWLSNEKNIRNPFMGAKMPGCGMVKETIE